MPELYCPRCDRRLTPDHRCVSRRVFLFGAMAMLRPPKLYDMAAIDKVLPKFSSKYPETLGMPIFRVPVTFRFGGGNWPIAACGIGLSEKSARENAQAMVAFYGGYGTAQIGTPERMDGYSGYEISSISMDYTPMEPIR